MGNRNQKLCSGVQLVLSCRLRTSSLHFTVPISTVNFDSCLITLEAVTVWGLSPLGIQPLPTRTRSSTTSALPIVLPGRAPLSTRSKSFRLNRFHLVGRKYLRMQYKRPSPQSGDHLFGGQQDKLKKGPERGPRARALAPRPRSYYEHAP